MEIITPIRIDMQRTARMPEIYAKQGDACTRKVQISLSNGGISWSPGKSDVAIRFCKSDGTGGIYDKLPDGTKAYAYPTTALNDVIITLAPEVLTCAGDVLVDVVFSDSAEVLATFSFVVHVQASPMAGIATSNSYYNYQSLADINRAIDEAKAAAAGSVKSVNGINPDANGGVTVPVGVTAVNRQTGSVTLPVNAYTTCSTAANYVVKTAALVDGFAPAIGAVLAVRFVHNNTAESPKLDYNGIEYIIRDRITAKPIAPSDITAGLYQFMLISGAWILLDKIDNAADTLAAQIGDLAELDTTDKSSIVAALNEVLASGGGSVDYFSVSYDGAGIIWGSAKPSIRAGAPLTTSFSVAENYTLQSVKVLMGGINITASVYDAAQASINIPAVTGDVIITCITEKEPELTPINVEIKKGRLHFDTGEFEAGVVATRYATDPAVDATELALVFKFLDNPDYNTDATVALDLDIHRYDAAGAHIGTFTLDGEPTTNYWINKIYIGQPYTLQAGYKYRLWIAKPSWAISNDNFVEYLNNNVKFWLSDEVSTTGLSVDADYAMDYDAMPAALTPEASNKYLAGAFADAIISARNEWMREYNGDIRKIPVILHTDQHGRLNTGLPLFDFLSDNINWYEISKIINLGDVVADHWSDADTEHPLTECAELDNYLSCYKRIPHSKRLDIFGNHDTWYHDENGADTVVPDQARLSRYFKNIYARRDNNSGYFVVKDNYFNVKYVVLSCFEYTTSRSVFRISTAQMLWLIDELSKNDGYDVIIVSHVPLLSDPEKWIYPTGQTSNSFHRVSNVDTDAFFAARKTKGAGTITDSDGVVHDYDFSGCTTDLLCSLHGHTHHDGYLYLNGVLLVNVFDWFADTTFFFILVDRKDNQLNVWKVSNPSSGPQVQNYQIPFNQEEGT